MTFDGKFHLYGWCYQAFQRLAHRFNWHHMVVCYPNGDTLLRCQWCGITVLTKTRYMINGPFHKVTVEQDNFPVRETGK